ncbi:DUF928 domain-containing protein [Lyngbya aestuarii]|uniref:DUF928 domain-containing protein n=1 Tax=Lyngbya aestuarii TaxID=118322 RepID=UPI00403DC8ED
MVSSIHEYLYEMHYIAMAWKNSCLPFTILSAGLYLELVLIFSPSAQGQELVKDNLLAQNLINGSASNITNAVFEPPGDGEPENTEGGATRDGGKCPQDATVQTPYVTPLMPANQEGLTVMKRPQFLIYVPQTVAKKAFFSLKEKGGNYSYQTTVPISNTPGVISFKLPVDAPVLEIGQDYQWSFVLICDQSLRPDDPWVQGKIKRVEPNPTLSRQLENSSKLELAALYQANGLWYDALAILSELKRSQPNDVALTDTWEKLLKSVGLGELSSKPLLR